MTQPCRSFWCAVFAAGLLFLPNRAAAQSGTVTDDAFLSSNTNTQQLNLNGQGIVLVVAGSSATVGSSSVGLTKSYILAKSAKDKLDGVRIVGAQPFTTFQAAIESLLKTEIALKN